jgi:hypothetical protein
VLDAAGTTGSATDLPELTAAASLAGSLREAATHADAAAREVERGRIKEVIAGKPSRAAWHHGGTQGCSHFGIQHNGTVSVVISTPSWSCYVVFVGSLTRTGPPPTPCGQR